MSQRECVFYDVEYQGLRIQRDRYLELAVAFRDAYNAKYNNELKIVKRSYRESVAEKSLS